MNTKLLLAIMLMYFITAKKTDALFQQFLKFKDQYKKQYNNIDEFILRFNLFKTNFLKLDNTIGKPTHIIGITKYSDLTTEEFKKIYLTLRPSVKHHASVNGDFLKALQYKDAPDAFDWRDKGVVSGVKDQGKCGSCWAFSTVGNLEGVHAIKTGKLISFSEQQIVDCDHVGYDQGCEGGDMASALDYIKNTGGIECTSDYPYNAQDNKCTFDITKIVIDLKVIHKIVNIAMDEEEMKGFLYTNGPLAVGVNAYPLLTYVSGIIDLDTDECDPSDQNHAVTLVGYGTENGKDFWIVKNSWGAEWGEKGYFRIARGKGTCGINIEVVTAVLANS
jgi:cathepsin F